MLRLSWFCHSFTLRIFERHTCPPLIVESKNIHISFSISEIAFLKILLLVWVLPYYWNIISTFLKLWFHQIQDMLYLMTLFNFLLFYLTSILSQTKIFNCWGDFWNLKVNVKFLNANSHYLILHMEVGKA